MLGLVKHTPWKQKEVGLLAHATASANVAASTSAGKGAVVKLWVFTRVVTLQVFGKHVCVCAFTGWVHCKCLAYTHMCVCVCIYRGGCTADTSFVPLRKRHIN